MSFQEILATCIAYFDMSILEAKRCTLRDFYTYSIAYRLKEQKEVYHLNLLAWQSHQAGAVKKNGKPAFSKFDEFYDYQKNFITALKGEAPKEKKKMSIADMNMLLNS